ncbi:MAG: fructose-bisphosphate aldolase, class I [Microgenomates group bacterium Gr01-1014_5]|nr:MAG: fructose-bisphosphate aldolase, class I [Microgenomates group bacterium Gr01-1014_5]
MSSFVNLDPILRNGHGMLLAYDHGFEHGPMEFDEQSADPAWIMDIADSGHFTGVICQKGIAARYYSKDKHKVPLILKVNGKTGYHKDPDEEPISVQNCTVEEAIALGAVGVGYTIYVGSEHENKMIAEFSAIEREAHEKGLIVMGWMYPRGHHIEKDTETETLAYAARLGLELNCDAVKIKYTGNVESFKRVVHMAGSTKVFVVGGPKTENATELLTTAQEIIEAGAAGLAVGRNIWQAEKPLEVAERLAGIIYK